MPMRLGTPTGIFLGNLSSLLPFPAEVIPVFLSLKFVNFCFFYYLQISNLLYIHTFPESILHIHLAKEGAVKTEKSEHSLLQENIGKTIKENEMFLEQVQKLCLSFELKHQIAKTQTNHAANGRKAMHTNSAKMEAELRKQIKGNRK